MANSRADSSLPNVPWEGGNPLLIREGIRAPNIDVPPEKWELVEALFARLLEDGKDPDLVLAAEPDRQVAQAALQLWCNHRGAVRDGFLDKCLTFVLETASAGEPCFSSGQILAGRFTIDRMVGVGGMGEVYSAYDGRLEERVALKTIRRDLSSDPAMRRRFLAEIQNARRVTHPNVCRIFDLFDEGDIPFFAMEHLEGIRLSDWLKQNDHRGNRGICRRIALELADALAEAHRNGILHCDFKPANVILTGPELNPTARVTDFGLARAWAEPLGTCAAYSLRAGTADYMAPELLEGAQPSPRSDIYAYGKVLSELIPGHRSAARCLAVRPEERPGSLAPVIRELRGERTRRNWIVGGVVAVASTLAAYELRPRLHLVVAGRQRIVLNGFRPAEASRGPVLRELLVTALRQSPLLTVVTDDHLSALLRAANGPRMLPVDHRRLLAAVATERALVIEGAIEDVRSGLRLLVQVFEPGSEKPTLAFGEQTDDARQIVRLADRISFRLRTEFGESAASLSNGYTPLEQVTSASPEAVELYFHGVREYEAAHTEAAVALLDQAIRLDPNFALAHLQRGIALLAHFQWVSAIPSYEAAFALRQRLTERERLSVESRYYNFITDFDSSFKVSRRLVALFPEEATFQRAAAFAAVRIGHPRDALPYNDRAIDLDPDSENNISEWMVNRCAAGLPDDALALFQRCRAQGNHSTMLEYGAGTAWLLKEDYENARLAFERMGASVERDRWSRLLQCGPLMLEGRLAEAATRLRSDLAYDIAAGEQSHLQTRRVWLGMAEWLMDSPALAREQAAPLTSLDALPVWLQTLREAGMLAYFLGESALVAAAVDRLRDIERHWPSTHTRGSRAHLEALTWMKQDQARADSLLNEAHGLWPDCLTLYSLANWQMGREDFGAAATTLEAFEEQRGSFMRLFFPPMLILGRIERARCLARLSRFPDSLRLYQWVLGTWAEHAGSYRIVREIRSEYEKLSSILHRR